MTSGRLETVRVYFDPDKIGQLRERGYEVVTMIKPAETFWIAEDLHQDDYAKHDKTPYCHTRVKRFGD